MGIKDLIIDPGFGFAKTIKQNFILLRHLKLLNMLGPAGARGFIQKSNHLQNARHRTGGSTEWNYSIAYTGNRKGCYDIARHMM